MSNNQSKKDFAGELYEKHSHILSHIAYKQLNNIEIAEELMQEVFRILVQKQDEIIHHPNPVGWLYKTLHYLVLREKTRKRYRSEYPLVVGYEPNPYNAISLLDNSLFEILPNTISVDERRLLELRYRDNLPIKEIAEITGVSEETCRKRVTRARNRLKKYLNSKGGL